MNYTANVKILLSSQFTATVPVIELQINQQTIKTVSIDKPVILEFETPLQPAGLCTIGIVFLNKDYSEFEKYNKDMMVQIDQFIVQDYHYDFSIHSTYFPVYPEPWATQQVSQGNILQSEIHSNYLGWNGTWQLALEMPVYRWIHKTVNLGWLI